MGKADFKKLNDHWQQDYDSRSALDKYYNNTCEISNGKTKVKVKKSKRSDHKHRYEQVLVVNNKSKFISLGKICTICNTIKIVQWAIFLKTSEGYLKFGTLSEIQQTEPYKNLRVIYINEEDKS